MGARIFCLQDSNDSSCDEDEDYTCETMNRWHYILVLLAVLAAAASAKRKCFSNFSYFVTSRVSDYVPGNNKSFVRSRGTGSEIFAAFLHSIGFQTFNLIPPLR